MNVRLGERAQVDWQRALRTSTTLYIGNLSFFTREEQIYEVFSKASTGSDYRSCAARGAMLRTGPARAAGQDGSAVHCAALRRVLLIALCVAAPATRIPSSCRWRSSSDAACVGGARGPHRHGPGQAAKDALRLRLCNLLHAVGV